jgi:sortase (surface protein transpeptidase)
VIDTRTTPLHLQHAAEELLLLTCYPFDVVAATGPLRYRVRAVPLDARTEAPSLDPMSEATAQPTAALPPRGR